MLFADLLSLHLVTFLMFFIVVESTDSMILQAQPNLAYLVSHCNELTC